MILAKLNPNRAEVEHKVHPKRRKRNLAKSAQETKRDEAKNYLGFATRFSFIVTSSPAILSFRFDSQTVPKSLRLT